MATTPHELLPALIITAVLVGALGLVWAVIHWWRRQTIQPVPAASPSLLLGSYQPGLPGVPRYLKLTDINNHKYILGNSGSGKSFLIISQLLQLYKQGAAFTFIDVNDTWLHLLKAMILTGCFKDEEVFDRIIFLEITPSDYFLPFNVLSTPTAQPDELANQIVETFHRLWPSLADGAAPRFDDIMTNGIRVLIDNGLPLPLISKLLTNQALRERLLTRTRDPDVVAFFHDRFDRWGRETVSYTDSTQTRIDLITNSDVLKYSLGQTENVLNPRRFMDEGISVVISLEGLQGNLPAQRLLGSLMTIAYEQAALSRHQIRNPAERRPHYLYIDEFAQFATTSSKSFETMLSSTRKYGLFLTLAHQQLDQASARLLSAVQNTYVKMVGTTGRRDAEILAKEFGAVDPLRVKSDALTERSQPLFLEQGWQWEEWVAAIQNMPKRHFMTRVGSNPSLVLRSCDVPTGQVDEKQLDDILQRYKQKYMKQKHDIVLLHQLVHSDGSITIPQTHTIQPQEPDDNIRASGDRSERRKSSRKISRSTVAD